MGSVCSRWRRRAAALSRYGQARSKKPLCKFEIMLCLVGGQGAGKSTFFRLLAVRDEWFSDDSFMTESTDVSPELAIS